MSNQMNQKEYRYRYGIPGTKNRIRKQSSPPGKPIIQLKLLGTITIDLCNIVVHIYSLFGP